MGAAAPLRAPRADKQEPNYMQKKDFGQVGTRKNERKQSKALGDDLNAAASTCNYAFACRSGGPSQTTALSKSPTTCRSARCNV